MKKRAMIVVSFVMVTVLGLGSVLASARYTVGTNSLQFNSNKSRVTVLADIQNGLAYTKSTVTNSSSTTIFSEATVNYERNGRIAFRGESVSVNSTTVAIATVTAPTGSIPHNSATHPSEATGRVNKVTGGTIIF